MTPGAGLPAERTVVLSGDAPLPAALSLARAHGLLLLCWVSGLYLGTNSCNRADCQPRVEVSRSPPSRGSGAV